MPLLANAHGQRGSACAVWAAIPATWHMPLTRSPACPPALPVQALVAWSLQHAFPGQPLSMVAEEDAIDLRTAEGAVMLARITALVNEALAVEHPQVGAGRLGAGRLGTGRLGTGRLGWQQERWQAAAGGDAACAACGFWGSVF